MNRVINCYNQYHLGDCIQTLHFLIHASRYNDVTFNFLCNSTYHFQLKEFIGDAKNNIFIDYAHTPDAFNNILSLINDIKEDNQMVITLFGCGGDRDNLKRAEMAKISEKLSDIVFVTSDNPRTESLENIMVDIAKGFLTKKHIIINDREEAIKSAIKKLDNNSILLILGKGRENYQIVGNHKFKHNDIKIVKEALNES